MTIRRTENHYLTTMVLESSPAAFNEENLRSINSSFIKEFVNNEALLEKNEVQSELGVSKPLFVGFAIVSGRNRAKKAIRLALSIFLLNNQFLANTKTVLLLISSFSIEINIDEIGEINDYIQENMGYNAAIVMLVSEDKNLGKSLSVTLMLSEFETPEK